MAYGKIVGVRFGKLTVLKEVRPCSWLFLCRCTCGKEVEVFHSALVDRTQVNCLSSECDRRRNGIKKNFPSTGHVRKLRSGRLVRSGEYNSWASMKYRILDPNCNEYHNYGGRGITICERWLVKKPRGQGFRNFLADMGARPPGMSLDRKDFNGDYCPENCCWALKAIQDWNQRRCFNEDGTAKNPDNPIQNREDYISQPNDFEQMVAA